MRLYFLGTGAGSPSKSRNVSGVIVDLQQECGELCLFDCGEATQHQMLRSPYSPRRLSKIFMSHLHGDHLFGLLGILDSRSMQGATAPLTLFAPHGIREYLEVGLRISHSRLAYELDIVEIDDQMVFSDKFVISCRRLAHVIPSFGYRITEKPFPKSLDVASLLRDQILEREFFARLKRGEVVRLSDGREIDGNKYLLSGKPARVLTLIGDTEYCQNSVELAMNADVLLHEATFADAERLSAKKYAHSCASDAARVASESHANLLILSHISARYYSKEKESVLLSEAEAIFPNVLLSRDFMSQDVKDMF